jgi:hypothetical protein
VGSCGLLLRPVIRIIERSKYEDNQVVPELHRVERSCGGPSWPYSAGQ